ncbi:MAG: ATPase [Haloferacaceae archaeon]
MKLLVAGGDMVDAGKTTFSTGLLARLREEGHAPVGFKPRAGNDFWFDHDDVRAALGDGRLYGKDARKLAAASAGEQVPEAVNPLHRLWIPTPGTTGLLGEADRTFLVDRLATESGTRYVVNGEAALPPVVADALPLAEATRVRSVPEFNEVMTESYLPAFERLAQRIRRTPDAVVESYGDVARPLEALDVDAVAVVRPTRVRVYGGPRYGRACEAASGSPRGGQLEERTDALVGMLDPAAEVSLPALPSDERADPDAVAAAYADAYDALLDLA